MAKKNRRPAPTVGIPAQRTEFNPDYTSVKTDLKRIGLLAGSFFALLFILKLFLK